jgi:inner membrane protein
MDNVTHSLAGALIGEAATRLVRERDGGLPAPARRNIFLSLMVIGSNLPDIDFVYSAVTRNKLDYLLQHRGHTHTVIGALVEAVLLFIAAEVWIRWRRLPADKVDRFWLIGLALLAPLLHISMDATNTFGVHPFWPFDNHWLYGDSVFILEPLLWAAAVPLLFTLRAPWSRALGVVSLLTALTWIFSTGLIVMFSGITLLSLTFIMLCVGWFASPRRSLFTAMGVWVLVTAMFIEAHSLAAREVEIVLAEKFPGAQTLDHALSPMPVNPVCWEVVTAQVQGNQYTLRRAMLSLAPAWLSAEQCPNRDLGDPTTAPIQPVVEAGGGAQAVDAVRMAGQWAWFGELTMPRDELAQLAETRCEVAAFLKFARAPWAERIKDRWVIGDLRYDREAALGFSEIELDQRENCPRHVPPWVAPRSELLR